MTQYRSKGKGDNRKVFPVNPRKPYGTSRQAAAEDVQVLRSRGMKARLIETNPKHKLYAPYESQLKINSEPEPSIQTVNPYQEKIRQKKERYLKLAKKYENSSIEKQNRASQMASVIPLGQPILVGHYSEKRDRNYRERIRKTMVGGIEDGNKAEYYTRKAQNVGKTISSDDPEATKQLNAKLRELEDKKEYYKEINRKIKKNEKLTDKEKHDVKTNNAFLGGNTIPQFVFTNLNSNIKRTKDRINQLAPKQSQSYREETHKNYKYIEDPQINRVMFQFNGKPDEKVRSQLKKNGFHWSPTENAWMRQLNNSSIYKAKILMGDFNE